MRTFQNYRELSVAYELPADAPGAFRMLPHFGPAGFVCAQCGQTVKLPTDAGGGAAGYSVDRDDSAIRCYPCTDARERESMLDRSRPFGAYMSSDGRAVTTWTGGILGDVVRSRVTSAGFCGRMLAVTVRDVHGGYWHGRGAGRSLCITLRPSKHAPR